MKAFGLELSSEILDTICAHAEKTYPNEACGLGFAPPEAETLSELVAMENVQDKYHALDPVQFPRTARDAFRLDEGHRLKLLRTNEPKGWTERLLYHSHPDAGAYFSPEDRASAVFEGMELMPGVVHVVVSVVNGVRKDMAAFKYDEAQESFKEVRLGEGWRPEAERPVWPDLHTRAMEGREAARPIAPVGGGLVSRRITEAERSRLAPLAEGRSVRLDAPSIETVRAFGAGLLSPLSGFMTARDAEEARAGRLTVGEVSWAEPIVLEVDAIESGVVEKAVVELVDSSGRPVGLLRVTEVRPGARCGLAGDVFVYSEVSPKDAAERRADWLRSGARQILALSAGTSLEDKVAESYDGTLAADDLPGAGSPWLLAVMAQNAGATHVLVSDDSWARRIAETLAIQTVAT